jgi:hypothetical protein
VNEIVNILKQLEHQRSAIERAILALKEITSEAGAKPAAAAAPPVTRRRKRRLSPEGRKAIGDAARKRWASKKTADVAAARGPRKRARKKRAA